jgi:hypothetical protein
VSVTATATAIGRCTPGLCKEIDALIISAARWLQLTRWLLLLLLLLGWAWWCNWQWPLRDRRSRRRLLLCQRCICSNISSSSSAGTGSCRHMMPIAATADKLTSNRIPFLRRPGWWRRRRRQR